MDEIEHDGKRYILKSSSIPKTQVEQMKKDRVSKVASKVHELEKIALERLEVIESLQEKQTSYDVLSQQFGDLQSKLEALAEKGVIPTTKQLEKFTLATIKSQFAKEKLQVAQEKLTKNCLLYNSPSPRD